MAWINENRPGFLLYAFLTSIEFGIPLFRVPIRMMSLFFPIFYAAPCRKMPRLPPSEVTKQYQGWVAADEVLVLLA